eukprot:GILK01004094.1.p1 GENE.GILK01004094.1~~GILK01004094.1.p1  ORF type:complete len:356 (+),score=42.02 GILK01004094.1:41-1108(+)
MAKVACVFLSLLCLATAAYGSGLSLPTALTKNGVNLRKAPVQDGWRFDPALEATYSSEFAQNLVYFSAAAYCPVEIIKDWNCTLSCAKYPGFKVDGALSKPMEDATYSTQYFVGHNDETKEIVLSFRGTNPPTQLLDEIKQPGGAIFHHIPGALVLSYFMDAYNLLADHVKFTMKSLLQKYPDYKLFITGHSMGGSLGVIAAMDLVGWEILDPAKTSVTIYTFGEPRTGNFIFAQAFKKAFPDSFRVVRDRDVVPHIPPCSKGGSWNPLHQCEQSAYGINWGPYHHPGEIWYDTNMENFKECQGEPWGEDQSCSDGLYVMDGVYQHSEYFGIWFSHFCNAAANMPIQAQYNKIIF